MFILDTSKWLCRMASNFEWHLSSCKHAEFDKVYIICLVIMELPTERIMSSNKYDKQLLLQNSEYVNVYIQIYYHPSHLEYKMRES